jgi:hypothetical protein
LSYPIDPHLQNTKNIHFLSYQAPLVCNHKGFLGEITAIISLIKEKELYVFFVGDFPEKNRRIFPRFLMKDIQMIKMEIQECISPRHVLYMEIKGRQDIPSARTSDNLNLREIKEKAVESAHFLCVSIEGF